MKKISIILAFICATSVANAQSADDAIKSVVTNYFEGITLGDTAKLSKAFHANAVLRTVNASSGKVQDIAVKSFIRSTPAGGVKVGTKLLSYSYAGTSGIAAVELQFETFKYLDLLSLLKVGEDWKIVTRVFSRVDLDVTLKGSSNVASTAKTANTPKKSTANSKPKKDDGW